MARTVRIARADLGDPRDGVTPWDPSEGYRPNLGGLTRAGRLFALFLVTLVASFSVFLGLVLTGPSQTSTAAIPALELLSVVAALLVVTGFWITLGRTPRGVDHRSGRLVVVEFFGARRVFVQDSTLRFTVENRYGTGLLSSRPTEMVAVQSARGPVRHYLVERDLFPVPTP
ncbi:MAG: hypothetical protein L3K08_03795 [Thermoplasmata archaeon]|nr:hypothetical protein [Thermoplasmata archaeon]